MLHRHVMGKEGMALAVTVSIAMASVAFFAETPRPLAGDMGFCLPSPNQWGLSPTGGWIFNLCLLLATTATLYLVNKQHTFVQGSDTVLTGMFLIMTTSNLWVSGLLTSSAMMALANLLCLLVLFGCYRKRNATQEIFVIATILSIGSMIQYAFIFMIPVYLIGSIMMKCFRFRVLVAFGMGLAAPYWVGIGLGILPLESFSMPTFTNLFDGYETKSGLFFGLLNISVTVVTGLILALNNGVKLYAGNTQRRLNNMVINLLGIAAVLCMLLDFNNMVAYMATIYMISAVQLANLFALWNIHRGSLWVLTISLLYVAGFVMMVIGS